MAELLYQQASASRGGASGGGEASGGPGTGSAERPAEGDVIDAEYVDVEEGKK
jgi:hypothetical protein